MTRAKTKPPVRKPVLEAEDILRFAASEADPTGSEKRPSIGETAKERGGGATAKKSEPERASLTLHLKADIVARLKAEAGRKERSIEQVVEKLVGKHLGKH